MRKKLPSILRKRYVEFVSGIVSGLVLALMLVSTVEIIPGIDVKKELSIEGVIQVMVTGVLAMVVLIVGRRFTDTRVAKDLIIEELREAQKTTKAIESRLRKYGMVPQEDVILEIIERLGVQLTTAQRMQGWARENDVRLNWPSGLEEDYIMLRRFLVGDEYEEEEALFYGQEVTRRMQDRLLEAIMMVNYSF